MLVQISEVCSPHQNKGKSSCQCMSASSNIYKLRKSLPHQTTHSLHLPQNVHPPPAKPHPYTTLNKPLCSCHEKAEQTARHLMIECSLFSKERPAVLQNLPLPLIMQYHINTVDVSSLLNTIYRMLQEQSERDQIL